MSKVAVIDYGAGNVRSIEMAIMQCGGEAELVSDPDKIAACGKIILPGVGAFGGCVEALRAKNLDAAVRSFIDKGNPVLGICVGFQMLFEYSDEQADVMGLGLFDGNVKKLPASPKLETEDSAENLVVRLPHIGWTSIFSATQPWQNSILDGIAENSAFYFDHNYYVAPNDSSLTLANCEFYGHHVCVAIAKDNIYAVQFHPEKSAQSGLKLFSNFINNVE